MERDVNEMLRTYGVTPPEKLVTYDGMSFLQGIIDGTVPAPPIAQTLGFCSRGLIRIALRRFSSASRRMFNHES